MILGPLIIIGIIVAILYYGWEYILIGICLWLLWLSAVWVYSFFAALKWGAIFWFLPPMLWVGAFIFVCWLVWRGLLCED